MTAVLLPNGKQQFFTTPGVPAVGYKLATFAAGTGVNQATWSDAGQIGANTNPIILDARGEAVIFWNGAYKVQLQDPTGVPIWTIDNVTSIAAPAASLIPTVDNSFTLGSPAFSWANLYLGPNHAPAFDGVTGNIGYVGRTPAEIAAGVTPVNFTYPVGHLYRYGTNTIPGTTDMTAAVANWALVGGQLTMPLPDIVQISGTVNFPSNTTVSMLPGAIFRTSTPGVSIFKAAAKSNVTIQGGAIQQTANNAVVHIGVIELNGCTNCNVNNVEIIGAQWHGIMMTNGTTGSMVEKCYIHNSLGSPTADVDSCDISCYGLNSLNTIRNNVCYGGLNVEHGIMLQDPGGTLLPVKILVDGNKVGPHKSYGILNYLIDHNNTYCTIVNNEVEGITGTAQGGNSGAGIYNQGAGGTLISLNTVRDCCKNTTGVTLLPAGIALNLDAAMEPVTVIGNHVLDMVGNVATPCYGIEVVTGPAKITGNTVIFKAGSFATIGVYVNLASHVQVIDNTVDIDTSIANSNGIFVMANGGNNVDIEISENRVNGCSVAQIRVDTTGAPTNTDVVIGPNILRGAGAACIPYFLGNIVGGSLTGGLARATTVNALNINACTQFRVTGGVFTTTGTAAVATNGVCTGSYYDKSNFSNTGLVNAATGMICEQLGSATPISGFNSAVGDRIEQSVPVVGNPKGWRCSVAGNPGTWVSEGNL